MPFIRVTTFGQILDEDQITCIQEVTTDLMVRVMRKPLGGISVLVEAIERGGWSIAGEKISVGAHVESTIGIDTNTSEEKSTFMSEMMAMLKSVLGPSLNDETYISFHEFSHDSYGRGGISRFQREEAGTYR